MTSTVQSKPKNVARELAVPEARTATQVRDILLFMVSYPHRTPKWAIEASLRLADRFDARISSALFQTNLPAVSNWLADKLVHANSFIASENLKSREAAQALLEEFQAVVPEERRGEQILLPGGSPVRPDELVRRARSHDLTIVPVDENVEYQIVAEDLVFGSGRPVLLLPAAGSAEPAFDNVIVGWDGSRSAARALADALPFCAAANTVRLVQITGDKKVSSQSITDIQRHLSYHGIEAVIEEVEAAERDAGAALMDHATETGADLLVMGAYGHSRTREFILGGATRTVLGDVRLSILLAH